MKAQTKTSLSQYYVAVHTLHICFDNDFLVLLSCMVKDPSDVTQTMGVAKPNVFA